MKLLKTPIILVIISIAFSTNLFSQCAAGEVEIIINVSGGSFPGEKWVNITTGPNGTGTVLWAQGNGTIGNGSGLLTNQSVCVLDGVTYYFNCYDQYDDTWDGTTYTISVSGTTIADNGGVSPTDGLDTDGSSAWQAIAAELETSEAFTANAPTPFPTDVCEDDAVINMSAPQGYSATSGKAGLAIILVTDAWASEITFYLYDIDGNLMYNETSFPGAPGSLANNTAYTIFDNECFDVTTTAGIPDQIDIFDSNSDGIFDNVAGLSGAGVYIYYYAADAIEVFNNDNNSNGIEYIAPGTGSFPTFYTASTNKRTTTITHTGASMTGLFPGPSTYEYVSTGSWSGTGVVNGANTSKTYFGGFPGLARTISVPSGAGTFNPTVPAVGANTTQTYTYNSVYGAAGAASCNTVTTTNTEVDVHARPTITPVLNQPCNGATYDVTVDVDLGTYNVSVDEDGVTAFSVSGSGGTLSTTSLTGTGIVQVTISNIPSGNSWSIDVSDVSGISCGLTGTNGNCATVLPIELISFWGEEKGSYNQLNWITATEINNDYFVIEKSEDGVNFEEVEGHVIGAGNSSQELMYNKIDQNPFEHSYYRLKQVDFNGEFSYSNIIVLRNNGEVVGGNVHLYPNPFNDVLNIEWPAKNEKEYVIEIRDYLGRTVVQEKIINTQGVHQLNLEKVNSKGIYFITISNNKQLVFSEKLIRM